MSSPFAGEGAPVKVSKTYNFPHMVSHFNSILAIGNDGRINHCETSHFCLGRFTIEKNKMLQKSLSRLHMKDFSN